MMRLNLILPRLIAVHRQHRNVHLEAQIRGTAALDHLEGRLVEVSVSMIVAGLTVSCQRIVPSVLGPFRTQLLLQQTSQLLPSESIPPHEVLTFNRVRLGFGTGRVFQFADVRRYTMSTVCRVRSDHQSTIPI